MIKLKTGVLLALMGVLSSCSRKHQDEDEAAPVPVALVEPVVDGEVRLRGYAELSRLVESSLLTTQNEFSLARYVGGGMNQFIGAYGLAPLMGYYNPDPVNPGWQNVSANTMSTAVYFLAFQDLAADLSTVCGEAKASDSMQAVPNSRFAELLKGYCVSGTSLQGSELRELWSFLTLHLAPDDDFGLWVDSLGVVDGLPVKERLEHLITVSLSSPWVLFHF